MLASLALALVFSTSFLVTCASKHNQEISDTSIKNNSEIQSYPSSSLKSSRQFDSSQSSSSSLPLSSSTSSSLGQSASASSVPASYATLSGDGLTFGSQSQLPPPLQMPFPLPIQAQVQSGMSNGYMSEQGSPSQPGIGHGNPQSMAMHLSNFNFQHLVDSIARASQNPGLLWPPSAALPHGQHLPLSMHMSAASGQHHQLPLQSNSLLASTLPSLTAMLGAGLSEVACAAFVVSVGVVMLGAPIVLLYLLIAGPLGLNNIGNLFGGINNGGSNGASPGANSISLTGPSSSSNSNGRKKRQAAAATLALNELQGNAKVFINKLMAHHQQTNSSVKSDDIVATLGALASKFD